MAWGIFSAVWIAIGLGLYHLNNDLPTVVWGMGYGLMLVLTAICVALWREAACVVGGHALKYGQLTDSVSIS